MIAKYNRRSLAIGAPGVLLQTAGGIASGAFEGSPGEGYTDQQIIAMCVTLLGTLMLIVGLGYYAKAKGREVLWCLLGFLGIIGLLCLALLEDRGRDPDAPAGGTAKGGNAFARVSIYMGIIGLLPLLGLPFLIAGVICGIVGLRRSEERGGRGAAIVGLVWNVLVLAGWGTFIALGASGALE